MYKRHFFTDDLSSCRGELLYTYKTLYDNNNNINNNNDDVY